MIRAFLFFILLFGLFQVSAQDKSAVEQRKDSLRFLANNESANLVDRANAAIDLGKEYIYITDYKQAYSWFYKSLELAEKSEDMRVYIRAFICVGLISDEMGDDEETKTYLLEAERLSIKHDIPDYLSTIYHNLSQYARKDGDLDLSMEYTLKGMDLITPDDKSGLHYSYNQLAILWEKLGSDDSSMYYLNKGLEIPATGDDVYGTLISNKAHTFGRMGMIDSASVWYEKAIDFQRELGSAEEEKYILGMYHLDLKKWGQWEKAYYIARQYNDVSDSLYRQETNIALAEMRSKFETKITQDKLEKTQKEQRLLIAGFSGIFLLGLLLFLFIRFKQQAKIKLAEQDLELKEAEMENLQSESQLRYVTGSLEGQSKERKRIGKDLHDVIGSQLSAVKLYFSSMDKNELNENNIQIVDKSVDLLGKTVQDLRGISHQMMRNELDLDGFIHSLQDYIQTIQSSTGISIEFNHHLNNRAIDAEVTNQLYWVISELITNINKHAQATEVVIDISSDTDEITATIEDNGVGFNPDINGKGIGLKNIQGRIESIAGHFNIDSQPGRGSIFIIDIPLKNE